MRASVERLNRDANLPADQLAELNWNRRVKLVEFCAGNIPFYQKRFKEVGFDVRDLKSEADFARLPVLEKEDIRKHTDSIRDPALKGRKLPEKTTGGTTGSPLKVYYDPRIHVSSMSWRMLNWWGVGPYDNSAYLYRKIPQGLRKLVTDIILYPTRRAYISAANMSDAEMRSFYRKLSRIRPKYLVAYVGALDVFVGFLERNQLALPGLAAVWTSSAPLPELKRTYFERVLGAPVYTQYGSCEFYWIAAECSRQEGLHIGTDIRHVEVVAGDAVVPTGGFGDILVTDLMNYAFPLLRYRIGDQGRLKKEACACGLPFPLMDYVRGRVSDKIVLPDGTAIPGEYWTTIFDDFTDTIKAFQVRQAKDYSVKIKYEALEGVDPKPVIKLVASRLQEKVSGALELSFQNAKIKAGIDGKIQFVVSELK